MKYKKILTISIIIIITIIIILLVLQNLEINKISGINNTVNTNQIIQLENNIKENNKNNANNNISNNIIVSEKEEETHKITRVKDNKIFYTIQNCVKKFESYVNLDYKNQVDELGYPSLAAEYNINNIEDKNKAILDLLDKDFIKDNNIKLDNVSNYVDVSVHETKIDILVVNKLIDKYSTTQGYSVYAKKTKGNKSEYIYYIVKITPQNVFCIYPIKNNSYSNIDEIVIENSTNNIEKNNRNTYIASTIEDDYIAMQYFQEYKNMILNNSKEAYNKLDEEYRNKRFGSLDAFLKYINENREEIELMQIYRYSVEENEQYKEYIAKDRYENVYIFKEKYPKDYTVQLDNYTLENEDFKYNYNLSSNESKGEYNTRKFINMINNKDYNNAYKLLDNTFKENNFNNLDSFTSFIKDNMFNINKINKISQTINQNYYIYNLEISDYEMKSTETKKMQIIINLKEGIDFTMSFSFK